MGNWKIEDVTTRNKKTFSQSIIVPGKLLGLSTSVKLTGLAIYF